MTPALRVEAGHPRESPKKKKQTSRKDGEWLCFVVPREQKAGGEGNDFFYESSYLSVYLNLMSVCAWTTVHVGVRGRLGELGPLLPGTELRLSGLGQAPLFTEPYHNILP